MDVRPEDTHLHMDIGESLRLPDSRTQLPFARSWFTSPALRRHKKSPQGVLLPTGSGHLPLASLSKCLIEIENHFQLDMSTIPGDRGSCSV